MLHSRESFGGEGERRLWRVWTWTTGSDGRPDGDGNPVSTPLDIHLALTAGQVGAVPTRDDDGSQGYKSVRVPVTFRPCVLGQWKGSIIINFAAIIIAAICMIPFWSC